MGSKIHASRGTCTLGVHAVHALSFVGVAFLILGILLHFIYHFIFIYHYFHFIIHFISPWGQKMESAQKNVIIVIYSVLFNK